VLLKTTALLLHPDLVAQQPNVPSILLETQSVVKLLLDVMILILVPSTVARTKEVLLYPTSSAPIPLSVLTRVLLASQPNVLLIPLIRRRLLASPLLLNVKNPLDVSKLVVILLPDALNERSKLLALMMPVPFQLARLMENAHMLKKIALLLSRATLLSANDHIAFLSEEPANLSLTIAPRTTTPDKSITNLVKSLNALTKTKNVSSMTMIALPSLPSSLVSQQEPSEVSQLPLSLLLLLFLEVPLVMPLPLRITKVQLPIPTNCSSLPTCPELLLLINKIVAT